MSSKTTSAQKKKAQKHQNKTPYVFDKWRTDHKAKMLKGLQVSNCCEKCTSTIEWKIKFGKYKMLTQPSKCVQCQEKKVKHAYHTRCYDCVKVSEKCAKCGEKEEFVAVPLPSKEEQNKADMEFQNKIKALPERRRRTFMRDLEKQEKNALNPPKSEDQEEGDVQTLSVEEIRENAKEKLENLLEKYSKDGLDGLDGDFDDFSLGDSDEGHGSSDEE